MLLTDARSAGARRRPTARWSRSPSRTAPAGTARAIAEGVALVTDALAERAARALPAAGRDRRRARRGARRAEETDWPQIVALYRLLERVAPNPMVTLNHAVAVGDGRRPAARARRCWPRSTATSGSPGTTGWTPSARTCSSWPASAARRRRRLPRRGAPHDEPARAALPQPACGTSLPWMSRTPGRLRPSCASDDPGGTAMTQVYIDLAISLDGFAAGPNQRLDEPFGDGVGGRLHRWMFEAARGERRRDRRARSRGRVRHGPQHVQPGPRRLGPGLDGLVGRGSALPRARVRPHPPRARAARDGGRHDVPLRDRRHRVGARAGARGGGRQATSRSPAAPATARQYLAAGHASTSCGCTSRRWCSARGERLLDGVGDLDARAARGARHRLVTHVRYRVVR